MAYGLLVLAAIIAEIASIFLVGSYAGAGWTVLLLVGAIGVGLIVLASRGVLTLTNAARAMSERQPVAPVVVDGAITAFAGLLLMVPGFASDVVGLLLLIPAVRASTRDRLVARFDGRVVRRADEQVIDTTAVEIPDPDRELPP